MYVCVSFRLASDQLLNVFLHRRQTVDFVFLHCKRVMKGSKNGQLKKSKKNGFQVFHLGDPPLFVIVSRTKTM